MRFLASYRRLADNGPLLRLLSGEFVSSIGDWLFLVALLVVVYERESSPAVLGIVGAVRVLPYILLSVPAGMVADRFDRRLVLLVTDIARGVVMLALALLVVLDGPLFLIIGATLLGTSFAAFFGPAIGAYLPSLARDESELGPANSAWASLDNLAFVIGPAVAGVLIATGGLVLAFLLNAVTFAVIAAVLATLPRESRGDVRPRPEAEQASPDLMPELPFRAQLRQMGRPLAGMTLINVISSFTFGGVSILTVVIAIDILQAGEAATGYLNAAVGVGGLIGAVASGVLVLRRRLALPLFAGGVVLGLGVIFLGQADALLPALVAMAVASTGSLVIDVTVTTLFQRLVPDAIRGRTLGIMETVSITAYAAGSFAIPILADLGGTVTILAAAGVVTVVLTLLGVVLIGTHATAAPALTEDQQRLLRHGLFAGLPPARLESAAKRARTRNVTAGTQVVRQGDAAEHFYLILEGRFAVTRAGARRERRLRALGEDDVFGEIGLLSSVPRTATVTALTDGRLLELDGGDFLELVGGGPGVSLRLMELYRGGAARSTTGG